MKVYAKLRNLYNRRMVSREYPRGVMVKAMDCGIVVSEFEFKSHYYIHFGTNTLGKGMKPLSSQLWVK